jgi:acetolactate synthase I/II/III large subunit
VAELAAVGAMSQTLTGGDAVARMLHAHDVGPIFGMGGFQLLPYYDAVRRLGMHHVLIEDERSGAFAADAYARVTGRPGVCDATQGPGATNLTTGLVESLNAGIPLIAIIGDTHRGHSWKNMTQEAHQLDILRPAAKEIIRIEDGQRIPELMRRAFKVCVSGRPGPVVVAVPEDIAHGTFEFPAGAFDAPASIPAVPSLRTRPAATDVDRAARLLSRSRRPVILAGGGIHLSGAYDALLNMVARHDIPVAHTLSGKGAIPCTHPLSAGLFGRYSRYANELIEQSDCIVAIGCKLGEIATKRYTMPPPATPLIQIDVSSSEIDRWTTARVGLCADAQLAIVDLSDALDRSQSQDRKAYAAEIAGMRATWLAGVARRYASDARPIDMARLIGEINIALPAEGIVVADGGFASHWAGLLYDTKASGRGFVSDRGFASIGYGLAGSMGAKLGKPDSPVVGLTGDGGLLMSVGGLEVARRAGVAFTLIVVNNAASGYVKALQHAVYGPGAYQSSDLLELNYADIAKDFGCHGIRVEDPDHLGRALKEGIERTDAPTILDVVVTRDPGSMLPGVDSRTMSVQPGDRPA